MPSDLSSGTAASAGTSKPKPTVYFGYGSNLWLEQMRTRCPESEYLGVARLDGYKWLINERGYANVVEVGDGGGDDDDDDDDDEKGSAAKEGDGDDDDDDEKKKKKKKKKYAHVVFGLVYALQPADEARLDRNEGVPHAYTKEMLSCDFWAAEDGTKKKVDVEHGKSVEKEMLVYIDRKRVGEHEPKKEYVVRMNHGIEDAVKMGVPEEYVKEVMRRFIPEEGEGEGRRSLEEKARRQAVEFRDENFEKVE
ncbi:hypothetical protein BS50DRAFT_572429 [Corynespora cassiicola Philippines]|uniref:gamma-glutamylcyclotransferase n=1 Tax=Corynespora cassiicola Philippines TaxID=1448308 RepID=A0A2T2NV46_CORCC|nr:hypothetical protein BS50DRAFT_572429 [Corynespora cassiicola Philippines]